MATETSEAERRANGAERELMDWKTAQFMEAHWAEYDALINLDTKFGCFVELFEVFVEGLLPSMPWKNSPVPVVSIANAIRHGRPIQSEGRRGAPGARHGAAPRQTDGMASRRPRSCPRRTHRSYAKAGRVALIAEIKEEFRISPNRRDSDLEARDEEMLQRMEPRKADRILHIERRIRTCEVQRYKLRLAWQFAHATPASRAC